MQTDEQHDGKRADTGHVFDKRCGRTGQCPLISSNMLLSSISSLLPLCSHIRGTLRKELLRTFRERNAILV
ncbi:MAG: hypothetical protein R3D84_08075 [Paracoccaceae bacterium]